jgi:hypothetical protein
MDRFIHLPEFRVIICKECKYAVLLSHINAHFAGKPVTDISVVDIT